MATNTVPTNCLFDLSLMKEVHLDDFFSDLPLEVTDPSFEDLCLRIQPAIEDPPANIQLTKEKSPDLTSVASFATDLVSSPAVDSSQSLEACFESASDNSRKAMGELKSVVEAESQKKV